MFPLLFQLHDYDEVLKAKDGVIEQLTVALRASEEEKEQAQKESMAQASQLADEIHRLQQQLKQVIVLILLYFYLQKLFQNTFLEAFHPLH